MNTNYEWCIPKRKNALLIVTKNVKSEDVVKY